MFTTRFFALKGGQGVTVTAAAYAVLRAKAGRNVLLIGGEDTFSALGLPVPEPTFFETGEAVTTVAHGDGSLTVSGPYAGRPSVLAEYDEIVRDGGPALESEDGDTVRNVLVTRGCYLALRRAADLTKGPGRPDAVVLIAEAGRALGPDDVAACIGARVLTVAHDPAIARSVDAGLLASRIPATYGRSLWAVETVDAITTGS